MSDQLRVPSVTADQSTLAAALAYAAAGWYVGPVDGRLTGTAGKNPGSILGKHWQMKTSRDPQVITAWFAGTDHRVFLHAGRSGAVVFDVDQPDRLHPAIRQAIHQYQPPWQSTRPDQEGRPTDRGHYLFLQPEGRRLGNALGKLASGWGEIRGVNGVIIVAPSDHPEGGRYTWQHSGPVPMLPGYLATQLPDAHNTEDAATDAQVTAFLTGHGETEAARPELLDIHIAAYRKTVNAGESRHNTMVGHVVGAMKEAAAGLLDGRTSADTLEAIYLPDISQTGTGPKQGGARTPAAAASEWAGILAWAVAQAAAADPADTRQRVADRFPRLAAHIGPPAPDSQRRHALAALLADLRSWQHLPDPTHVVAALAAAASRHADAEPVWLLLVAPPSSGKTEAVRILDDTADARLDEVTAAGLLGWSKGKNIRPTGVLSRVGATGLVTFGDLSTLLATSDRGGRDQVFALLRRAYDGHVTRDISPPGNTREEHRLEWSGRLTVVGCVTGAIDRYTAHADQLGARWIYIRVPARTRTDKQRAADLSRQGRLAQHRAAARTATAELLRSLPEDITLPDHLHTMIIDAAIVTAWGRGTVPRNGYGRREIEGMPVVEEPMRLVQQLDSIARGVLALGLPADAATYVVRRIALDSMPESRRAVLETLAGRQTLSTSAIARIAAIDRKVARFNLEELTAIGVLTNDRIDDDQDEPTGVVNWELRGDDGQLIRDVFTAHANAGGWDETWVAPPQSDLSSPLFGERGGFIPTFRPTPVPADDTCPACARPLDEPPVEGCAAPDIHHGAA